jgi:hypothetical protein
MTVALTLDLLDTGAFRANEHIISQIDIAGNLEQHENG